MSERESPRSNFVGRAREIGELFAALDDRSGGHGDFYLVSGEPGIGKTRLIDELASHARARGVPVVWGRCWEGAGAPAYWPWIQVIRGCLDAIGLEHRNDLLQSEVTAHIVHEIALIVPELRPAPAARPSPSVALDAEAARFRLFDAVANLLKGIARSHPMLVLFDDLHDADHASLMMLQLVARELRNTGMLIVGTYRDVEVRRSPALTKLIGDLSRDARSIALGGLSEPEVATFVEMSAGQTADPELVAKLYAATDGNPLFVEGIVRLLIAQRDVSRASLSDLPFTIPDGVRAAIRLRVGALSKDTISLLSIAAVLGKEFEVRYCQPVSGFSSHKTYRLLDEAATAGIVIPLGQGNSRFSHALIRDAVYEEIKTEHRAKLHLKVGEAIEAIHGQNLEPHLAALAHHFREAGVVGDWEKAINYSIRAGDEARRVFANEEAVSHWSAALKLVEEFAGERRDCADLHDRLGGLMGGLGDHAKSVEHLEKALQTYEELGDVRKAAELHVHLGNLLSISGLARAQDVMRAADHLRKAEGFFSKGPENSSLAEVNFYIGQVALRGLRVQDAVAAYRNAMEIAERVGDVNVWGLSAGRLASALPLTGNLGEALDVQARVWSKLDEINAFGHAFGAVWSAGGFFIQLWDPREAQRWWATELAKPRLASGQRKVFLRILQNAYLLSGDLPSTRKLLAQAPYPYGAGMLAFYEGEWEQADTILEQGLERALSGTPDQMLVYRQALARVRRIRSESVRAKTLLEGALASYPDEESHCQLEMVVRPELALIHVEMGAIKDAVAQVSRCRELSAGEDWRGLEGHLARAEAVVAAATGKLEETEAGFARAVTIFRKYAVPWEEADTLQRWGRVIATAEPVQAIEKFDAAIEIYRRHGAGQRWIDRVEADKHRGQPLIESEQTVVVSSKLGGEAIFRNEGEFWTIGFASRSFRLRNMKGLAYIAYLLAHPGERIHVCDLVTIVEGSAGDDSGVADAVARTASDGIAVARDLGDGVPMLDHQAKAQYRARLSELRKELEEAERMNDSGTAERIRQELEFVDDELSAAVGLGGRDRKMSDHAERARLRIGKAIRYSLSGILEHDLSLGHHFSTCIRTGYFCAYTPDPSHRQSWKL